MSIEMMGAILASLGIFVGLGGVISSVMAKNKGAAIWAANATVWAGCALILWLGGMN